MSTAAAGEVYTHAHATTQHTHTHAHATTQQARSNLTLTTHARTSLDKSTPQNATKSRRRWRASVSRASTRIAVNIHPPTLTRPHTHTPIIHPHTRTPTHPYTDSPRRAHAITITRVATPRILNLLQATLFWRHLAASHAEVSFTAKIRSRAGDAGLRLYRASLHMAQSHANHTLSHAITRYLPKHAESARRPRPCALECRRRPAAHQNQRDGQSDWNEIRESHGTLTYALLFLARGTKVCTRSKAYAGKRKAALSNAAASDHAALNISILLPLQPLAQT